jgi:hypothetical protein
MDRLYVSFKLCYNITNAAGVNHMKSKAIRWFTEATIIAFPLMNARC